MREFRQLYMIVFPALIKCCPIGIGLKLFDPGMQAGTSEGSTQFTKYSMGLERATQEQPGALPQ